jgi:histone deacetylase 1/2
MVASSHNPAGDDWYLDSGASHHLTQNERNLNNFAPYTGTNRVTVDNGKHLSISNTGSHRLVFNSHSFQLRKVFHVPFISANLISVAKLCSDNNALIEFRSNSFIVKDLHTKKVLMQGRLENGLYKFPVLYKNKKMAYVGVHNPSTFHSHRLSPVYNKVELWHHRLGHAVTNIVVQVMQSCNVSYERNKVVVCSTVCSSCQMAKSHRLPPHLSFSRASKPLELIHTDIWGPAMLKFTSGAKYSILFLDDYSRYTWFYPLQTKDQVLLVFKQFKLLVENQFDAKIKCLQSNNSGEYQSFMNFLQ